MFILKLSGIQIFVDNMTMKWEGDYSLDNVDFTFYKETIFDVLNHID